MFKTRSVSLAGFCFSWHESRLMQLPPTDQLITGARSIAAKSPTRFWIVFASVVMHGVIAILLLVPLPLPSLNAQREEPVTLELIVEPEPPPEDASQEQEEQPELAEPEEPPPEEPPPAEPEEVQSEPPLSILPDIAIRPEEGRLDAVDSDGQKPSEAEEQAAEPPSEPKPVDEPVEERSDDPSEDQLSATSDDGELPVGQTPPLPIEKPVVARDSDQQEEREPISASAIEGRGLRQMMGELPPNRRLTQICSIEVLAQIRATNAEYARVVGLVPFSDEGGLIAGSKLTATGGAFNLGGSWVEVDFTCEVDLDRYRVTRFSQMIGKALSRDEAIERGFTRFE
jgi:hypothetical protein